MQKNRFTGIRIEKRPGITEFRDLSESGIELNLLFSDHSKIIDGITLNKLDLFNMKGISDLEIENIINDFLKNKKTKTDNKGQVRDINIDMSEGIDIINSIFYKSLDFYQNDLHGRLLKEYSNSGEKYFKTKSDVIKFLKDTQKGIKRSQMNCSIAKIAYSINEIIDHPELLELDQKAQYFLQRKVMPGVIVDDFDSLIAFGISKGRTIIKGKTVEFNIRYRSKDGNSSVFKIIKDPLYFKGSDIKDSIGIELEAATSEDIVLLLEHFYYKIFSTTDDQGELIYTLNEFKNKGIITNELITEMNLKGLIDSDFLKILNQINYTPKSMQNLNYKDAKIVGTVELPIDINDRESATKPHGIEFRCILVGNTNEEGLADHRILEIGKIILTWIRLRGYITDFFVKYLINDLLEKNEDLDNKFSKDEILDYFLSKLEVIPRKGKIKIFTSKKRNLLEFYQKK